MTGTARRAARGTGAARSARRLRERPGGAAARAWRESGPPRPWRGPAAGSRRTPRPAGRRRGAASVDAQARAGPVDVALVVERHRRPSPSGPWAAARRRLRRRLGTGSSAVLLRRSSLRALARSQPFCTNVSLPSGRTSETVTWRSTLGAEERIHASSAPAPTTAVSAVERRGHVGQRGPGGVLRQWYGGRRGPQPVRAGGRVAGEARRRPSRRLHVNASAPAAPGWRRRAPRRQRGTTSARCVPGSREAREGAARSRGRERPASGCPRRCRTGCGPAGSASKAAQRRRVGRAAPGSGRRAASRRGRPSRSGRCVGASAARRGGSCGARWAT